VGGIVKLLVIALGFTFSIADVSAAAEILCEVDAVVSTVTPTAAISEKSPALGYFNSVLQLLVLKLTDGPAECLKTYTGPISVVSMKQRYQVGQTYRFVFMTPPSHIWAPNPPNRKEPIVQPKVHHSCQSQWIDNELVIVSLKRSKMAPTKPGLFFDVKIEHAHDPSWKSHDTYTVANLQFEQLDSPTSFYKVNYTADVKGAKLTLALSDTGIGSAVVKLPTRAETYDSSCSYSEVGY
jgi:hypothetical protein